MKKFFVTGFPGFIARELIREANKQELFSRIYVLSLPHLVWQARELLSEIAPGKGIVIEGDITKENLGIDQEIRERLQSEITHVFHLAAIYDLGVKREAAYNVNVMGTRNVNSWVKTLDALELYTYYSTAYVSGKREGIIAENELDETASFKNYYEETKWLAEKEVLSVQKEVPSIIIRPGVVVGHSKTGETVKFDGPYYMLELFWRLRFYPFIPGMKNRNVPFNIVPVDYLIQTTLMLSMNRGLAGVTYHVTDPAPLPIGTVYDLFLEKLINMKPIGKVSPLLLKRFFSSDKLSELFHIRKEAFDYFLYDVQYDCSNTLQALKDTSVSCPSFDTYADVLVNFFKENRQPLLKEGVKNYARSQK